jgi:hypothetical protein
MLHPSRQKTLQGIGRRERTNTVRSPLAPCASTSRAAAPRPHRERRQRRPGADESQQRQGACGPRQVVIGFGRRWRRLIQRCGRRWCRGGRLGRRGAIGAGDGRPIQRGVGERHVLGLKHSSAERTISNADPIPFRKAAGGEHGACSNRKRALRSVVHPDHQGVSGGGDDRSRNGGLVCLCRHGGSGERGGEKECGECLFHS